MIPLRLLQNPSQQRKRNNMALRLTTPVAQQRTLRLDTAPVGEPVTVLQLQNHLNIEPTEDQDLLASLISVARQDVEDRTGVAFFTQTWSMFLDTWPNLKGDWWDGVREGSIDMLMESTAADVILFSKNPLVSVDQVKTFDDNDVEAVVDATSLFTLDTISLPPRMRLRRGQVWPVADRRLNAIQITFSAGFGLDATAVPETLKQAVLLMAAYLYSHRGDDCDPTRAFTNSGAAAFVGKYRVTRL
jgi:uncharacterized phiE125 gp8 family phage protein